MVKRILTTYKISSREIVQGNLSKKIIKDKVISHWEEDLRDAAAEKSTLSLMQTSKCKLNSVHPIWKNLNNQLEIKKATIKTQLLIQRYPLYTCYKNTKQPRDPLCPLCKKEDESTTHFLLHCQELQPQRTAYLPRIMNLLRYIRADIDSPNIVRYILDSNSIDDIDSTLKEPLESLSRDYIFKIHSTRATLLGNISPYINK